MTLVNTRAALEKAVTDSVQNTDPSVILSYDNVAFTKPGQTQKYITINIIFNTSTLQLQGAAVDFFVGTIQCNLFVPKSVGTAIYSDLAGAVIKGLSSVNEPTYIDTYECKPRTMAINGPIPVELEGSSHYMGIVSCQFSANA